MRHQVVLLLARVLPVFGRLDWRFFLFSRVGLYTCIVAGCV